MTPAVKMAREALEFIEQNLIKHEAPLCWRKAYDALRAPEAEDEAEKCPDALGVKP